MSSEPRDNDEGTIQVRFVKDFETREVGTQNLVYGDCTQMTMCVCGEMFHAHGPSAEVSRRFHEWQKGHDHCTKPVRDGSKIFWMSFCDPKKSKGTQWLGGCVVEVTAEEADACEVDVMLRFPFAQPGSEWEAAATKKAYALGCNPGGEILFIEIEPDNPNLAQFPRNVLLNREQLAVFGPIQTLDDDESVGAGEPPSQ